ncbi:MAG TPA: choice-of-anchor R domain-containing protein [Roseiarcus sp.]
MSAASGGTAPATVFGSGPLYDSFSTGNSGFYLASVSLLLNATDPGDGGEYNLAVLADFSGSPGDPISGSAVSCIKLDSDLSTSLEVLTFFPRLLLSPNTRYWFGMSASPSSSANWSYSSDISGVGVAGESWANTAPDGTSDVFSNADGRGPFQLAIASPEPATWAMMLVGLGSLGLAAFHRRRKAITALR